MSFKKLFDIVIYKTDNFDARQDWEVPIKGFFILAPKRKVRSITDFSEEEAHELIDILIKIRKAMKKVLNIKSVYIFQGEKTRFNFHVWILPHYNWMDKISGNSLVNSLRYAKNNMTDERNIKEVEEAAFKVREYLK